jgi:hypothetical protein
VDVCRIKKRVKAKKKGNEAMLEVLMGAEQSNDKGHLWIGDSGASIHMTNLDEGLYDVEESNQVIIVGNGEKLKAIKTGKLKMKTKDLNGNEVLFILNNVKYVPGLWKNLFSVGKALKEGAKLESSGKNKTMTPYEEFYGKEALYTKSLRNFGQMCIRTVRKGHQDKLKNRGDVCIFVSYLDNHYHDTYRLLNVKKKKIIESRDVRWTGKMYGTYKKKQENENEEESDEEREEDFGLSMATLSDPLEPKLFKSAWYHKVEYERDGWRKAIQ